MPDTPISGQRFGSAIASLWFRLISLGIVGWVFAEALFLSEKIQGWTYYLATWEVVFEVAQRAIAGALVGVAFGTVCTATLAPFLWYFKSSRERLVDRAARVTVVVIVFLDSRYALTTLMTWSRHGGRFATALFTLHFLFFVVAVCIPRTRREVLTSLDGFLSKKMTRRLALATALGTVALVGTEFALAKTARTARAALVPQRPKSNFLLITFDALSAEDMSLYGYGLPTTPNIDTFARKSTVFTKFYAASTFTTPCIATMLTGVYPSESHVHQLQGRVRAEDVEKTLPHLMRSGGYATGAFVSNPWAYYFVNTLASEYDLLPAPTFKQGGLQRLWEATALLHQDSGIGNRLDEYNNLVWLWNFAGHPEPTTRVRAASSFEEAREILAKLPDGFFLWVHVVTPHNPYLPDATDRGRFLPYGEQRGYEEEESELRFKPHYPPDQQSQVDRRRLLYDEFILTADRAFGSFLSALENTGKLRHTTVILSADHGESFEGGVFQHKTRYQTRPVIHIPLIIRTPDQQEGRTVAFTADQTALVPTILELAGQAKPEWMRGESLVKWLNWNGQGDGEGVAFTQYLDRNSVFRPLRHGTVGVIDGRSQYQYLFDLDTTQGSLRPLKEAHMWNLDRSAENPALAEALRAAIFAHFPELVQESN